MKQIKIAGYECYRCSHQWSPRKKKKPRVCPHCKSPYWDRPRQKDIIKYIIDDAKIK
jgi:DNA-directed RNA polymerase subunit RPC12/RpoP